MTEVCVRLPSDQSRTSSGHNLLLLRNSPPLPRPLHPTPPHPWPLPELVLATTATAVSGGPFLALPLGPFSDPHSHLSPSNFL